MRYTTILYDIDGTLFDYEKAEERAFRSTMERFGLDNDLNALKEKYVVLNIDLWQQFEEHKITADFLRVERFRQLLELPELSEVINDIKPEDISEYYIKRLAESTELIAEAKETVDHFHTKVDQVLISNGLVDVQIHRVRNSELGKYFESIYISEEIGIPKPQPGIFEYIFSDLNIREKESVIIIGDNLGSDIKGGYDFGIDTCWFNPNKLPNRSGVKPVYEIKRLSELRKIIEGGEK
jgi:putative hydrolase of the HAD superfamily